MPHAAESRDPGKPGMIVHPARVQRKARDGGQSMLEFALMLPFLMLLMIGVIETGRAIYYTVEVNHAATAGVEYGAQNATTAQNIGLMESDATSDAGFPGTMTATAVNGCACDDGTGISCSYPLATQSNCPSFSCPQGQQLVECVQVTTQATITPLFHFPGLPMNYQANGEAVMRVRK
jgi:Flp pilus assembly protein TadG